MFTELLEKLRNTNANELVVVGALNELRELGPISDPALQRSAVEALIARLRDSSGYIRERTAWALGSLGRAGSIPADLKPAAIDALRSNLRDSHHIARERAAAALGEIATSADRRTTEALIRNLKDGHGNVRDNAAAALGKLGAIDNEALRIKAVDDLVPLLRDEYSSSRGNAARALGLVGPIPEPNLCNRVITELLLSLQDSDVYARFESATALARLGRAGSIPADLKPAAIDALRSNLRDSHHIARERAAYALGEISTSADRRTTEALILNLKDGHGNVRDNAAAALGKLGTIDDEALRIKAVADLLELLRDEYRGSRSNAAKALGLVGPILDPGLRNRVIRELLLSLQDDSDVRTRFEAAKTLGELGPSTDPILHRTIIQALAIRLTDPYKLVRDNAAFSLEKLGGERAEAPVQEDRLPRAGIDNLAESKTDTEAVLAAPVAHVAPEQINAIIEGVVTATAQTFPRALQTLLDVLRDIRDATLPGIPQTEDAGRESKPEATMWEERMATTRGKKTTPQLS